MFRHAVVIMPRRLSLRRYSWAFTVFVIMIYLTLRVPYHQLLLNFHVYTIVFFNFSFSYLPFCPFSFCSSSPYPGLITGNEMCVDVVWWSDHVVSRNTAVPSYDILNVACFANVMHIASNGIFSCHFGAFV